MGVREARGHVVNTPQDPIGDLAEAAAAQHEMYLSWVGAGFTPDQAMELVKTTITVILRRATE